MVQYMATVRQLLVLTLARSEVTVMGSSPLGSLVLAMYLTEEMLHYTTVL